MSAWTAKLTATAALSVLISTIAASKGCGCLESWLAGLHWWADFWTRRTSLPLVMLTLSSVLASSPLGLQPALARLVALGL